MTLRHACLSVCVLVLGCGSSSSPLGVGTDLASVRVLEQAMERGEERIAELRTAALEILAFGEPHEAEAGGTSRVVVVDTDRGRKLAKISYVRKFSSRKVPFILQDEAGRAGIAPAIHKLVEGDALTGLVQQHPALAALQSPWAESPDSPPVAMIVMDFVEDGFNFLQWERSRRSLEPYRPALLPAWTRRLHEIEAYANRHNIQLTDAQFLIQPDGNLVGIDLDHWTFVDSRRRRWAYSGITTYPDLDYWRVPSPDRKLNDLAPAAQVLQALFLARLPASP